MFRFAIIFPILVLVGCSGHRWHKSPSLAASGDTLYIANFCQVRAIDAKTGKEKWVFQDPHHKKMCEHHMKKYMEEEKK